jgi:hypothetical protein
LVESPGEVRDSESLRLGPPDSVSRAGGSRVRPGRAKSSPGAGTRSRRASLLAVPGVSHVISTRDIVQPRPDPEVTANAPSRRRDCPIRRRAGSGPSLWHRHGHSVTAHPQCPTPLVPSGVEAATASGRLRPSLSRTVPRGTVTAHPGF